MNYGIAFISFLIGCAVCAPLFKFLYKTLSSNASEFSKGYEKETNRDATEDFLFGINDSIVNYFAYANIVAFALPLIPSTLIAIPVYLLIEWLV